MLRRRSVIAGGCGALVLIGSRFPRLGSTRTHNRQFRVGIMGAQPLPIVLTGNLGPFVDELQKLGYFQNNNIIFDVLSSEGDVERFPALAAELVALNPQVILATNTPSIIALKKTGTLIPIVFTMIINNNLEIAAKRMQMLKELVPEAIRIAMFLNPLNPASQPAVDETIRQAGQLGLEII